MRVRWQPPPVRVEIADADSYVGSYEVALGVMLEVTTLGGDLYLQAPGQQKVPLVADSDGAFSIPMAGAQIVFERDDTGRITGLGPEASRKPDPCDQAVAGKLTKLRFS